MHPQPQQDLNEPPSSAARETPRDVDSTFSEDLTCAICFHIFTEPVSLQCGHSFCRTCVHRQWNTQMSRKCSICQQVTYDTDSTINFTLKNLSESYRKRSQAHPLGGCRSDLEAHKTPKNIREKQEAFEKVTRFCDSSIEHIKTQSRNTQKNIREAFEKLHLFLKEEEATRIRALKEEETEKIRMMQNITEISRVTFSLSDTVKDTEYLGVNYSFIQSFKAEIERTQNALPEPQVFPQSLINVSKHVENLQFKVWEKMRSIIKHTPVVLDPNSASPWLLLSDDLIMVKVTKTWQHCPGNPERCTNYPQVLGFEGFDSGKHCWEVEVGSRTRWILGVAKEGINRKEEMLTTPGNGLYTIMRNKRRYKDVMGNTLTLQKRLSRIRTELDYENGIVSFYDADSNTTILTYERRFTEKLYPYFGFVEIDDEEEEEDEDYDDSDEDEEDDENSSESYIQICKTEVSLTVK